MQYLPPSNSFQVKMFQHRNRKRRQKRLKHKADTNDNYRVSKTRCGKNRFKYMNGQGEWETLLPKKKIGI